jgi:ribosomal protein S18 acetylase RimI-like enzyme
VEIKFLDIDQLTQLYRTFIDSFSNYGIPFYPPSFVQFESDLERDGVDISRSIGTFDEGRLIGFSLNGFGNFSGEPTAYDASTGILPEYRQRHAASSMFEWLFPRLREQECRQMVLGVISSNQPAIRLYEKLGFTQTRELLCYQRLLTVEPATRKCPQIEIRPMAAPDPGFADFWDAEPSWQNSLDVIGRTPERNRIFGAFEAGDLCGYVIVSPQSGTIVQLGVAPERRRRGVGGELLWQAQKVVRAGTNLRTLNVDASVGSLNGFLKSKGFTTTITQLEMCKRL